MLFRYTRTKGSPGVQHPVHKTLKSHASIFQAKGQPDKLKQAVGGDDGRLLHVARVDGGIWWYPFLRSSLLKIVAPARLLVMSADGYVQERVAVGLSEKIEAAVVAARPP